MCMYEGICLYLWTHMCVCLRQYAYVHLHACLCLALYSHLHVYEYSLFTCSSIRLFLVYLSMFMRTQDWALSVLNSGLGTILEPAAVCGWRDPKKLRSIRIFRNMMVQNALHPLGCQMYTISPRWPAASGPKAKPNNLRTYGRIRFCTEVHAHWSSRMRSFVSVASKILIAVVR